MGKYRRLWSLEDRGEGSKSGWYAFYMNLAGKDWGPPEQQVPYSYVFPLMGWAIVTRNDSEEIVGIIANERVEEADRPSTPGAVFATYFQRGSWTQEQIDAMTEQLTLLAKQKQRIAYEHRQQQVASDKRDADDASQRRLLESGYRQVSEKVIREVQARLEDSGETYGPDIELPDASEVAEEQ